MPVITELSQITLEWLNGALQSTPALTSGAVIAVDVESMHSDNSKMVRLRLTYSDGAAGVLPLTLLLKRVADAERFGGSEVDYFARDYAKLPDAPIPTCYDAAYDDNPRRYHLLVEDLSPTHRMQFEVPPTLSYGAALARSLAALHAHHWGAAGLNAIGAALPDEAFIMQYVDVARRGFDAMLAATMNDLTDAQRDQLRDVFAHHPRAMVERTKNPNGFTLVHGDTNPGNILAPIEGDGRVYLIDRQPFDWSLTVWLGAHDLAYAIVTWWEPETRRALERDILRAYHAALVERGVTGYSWEQLWDDYRLATVQTVYVASQWCGNPDDVTRMRWVWFPELLRALAAMDDLSCAALWREAL